MININDLIVQDKDEDDRIEFSIDDCVVWIDENQVSDLIEFLQQQIS